MGVYNALVGSKLLNCSSCSLCFCCEGQKSTAGSYHSRLSCKYSVYPGFMIRLVLIGRSLIMDETPSWETTGLLSGEKEKISCAEYGSASRFLVLAPIHCYSHTGTAANACWQFVSTAASVHNVKPTGNATPEKPHKKPNKYLSDVSWGSIKLFSLLSSHRDDSFCLCVLRWDLKAALDTVKKSQRSFAFTRAQLFAGKVD